MHNLLFLTTLGDAGIKKGMILNSNGFIMSDYVGHEKVTTHTHIHTRARARKHTDEVLGTTRIIKNTYLTNLYL